MDNNTIQYNTIQYNTIQYNTIQYHSLNGNCMICISHTVWINVVNGNVLFYITLSQCVL
jgi:hypothetical protein